MAVPLLEKQLSIDLGQCVEDLTPLYQMDLFRHLPAGPADLRGADHGQDSTQDQGAGEPGPAQTCPQGVCGQSGWTVS